jgi:hypothetical protein
MAPLLPVTRPGAYPGLRPQKGTIWLTSLLDGPAAGGGTGEPAARDAGLAG